ncbi:MAG: hypothetical protein ACM3UV_06580 [Nocardioidaceae bacterium]
MRATTPPELDAWLPRPAVRTRHRHDAAVDAGPLWEAARNVRLSDTRTIGHLVRWRIPDTPGGISFAELLASYPFALLADGDGYSLSGLCGRIWSLRRDYPALRDASDFRAWREPGTVRVLFGHWVESRDDGGAALVSETRVEPVDRAAALRTRALWSLIGGFERFIGSEPLALAARRAEEAAGAHAAPAGKRPERTRPQPEANAR